LGIYGVYRTLATTQYDRITCKSDSYILAFSDWFKLLILM